MKKLKKINNLIIGSERESGMARRRSIERRELTQIER